MNEIIVNIKKRRSTKKYKPDMLPLDIIHQIVEAGTYAPSAKNKQSPIILVITNKQVRDDLAHDNAVIGGWKEDFDPFYGAPVVLVVLAAKENPNRVYDGSLVMENLMLAATSLGVGSCWIHRAKEEFEMPKWQQFLKDQGIEVAYEGIGHCIIGYADARPTEVKRKDNWAYYIK